MKNALDFLAHVSTFVLAILGLIWMIDSGPWGRDETDKSQWGARSGLRVLTDHSTGCKYIATVIDMLRRPI